MTMDEVRPPAPQGYDPYSPTLLDDPHAFWQTAREHPVFFYEPLGCWVLSDYETVSAALRDWETFSSHVLGAIPLPADIRDRVPEQAQAFPAVIADHILLNIDPPTHTPLRKAFQKAITRPLVAGSEARIRALANELIDGFIDDGACDLVEAYAVPLSFGTIADLLGLPPEVMPQMRTCIDDFVALLAPRGDESDADQFPMSPEQMEVTYRRLGDAAALFEAYLEERRARPQDDLASVLVGLTDDDGAPAMPYPVILVNMMGLAAAGGGSTANFISRMVRYLGANTTLRDRILGDPELWPKAVEEGLRRLTGTSHLMRVTTADVEVAGVRIPANSPVLLNIPGANSDACPFSDPLALDVERENAGDHLQFGVGRHFCLGAPLARLEARCALEELYRRIPGLTVDPDQGFEFHPGMIDGPLKALRVSWPV